jgi:2-C-methyl-D-erythritol 4-phosphate cytidylyltransferase/2-C-methyl-D-erythritol 2,4-cyclodiphosphate synthase
MNVAAVVVAAGRGERAGGGMPKQYRTIGGIPVIRLALLNLTRARVFSAIQPVVHGDDLEMFRAACEGVAAEQPVAGGATRQASVLAGLEALVPHKPDVVLVHDAARPFVSPALIARAVAAGEKGAGVPALAITDTVKVVEGDVVSSTLDRNVLRTIQTPQAFKFDMLLAAHRKAASAGRSDFPDDASLAEWAGTRVNVFQGDPENIKLTTPDDFLRADANAMAALGDVRVGSGYDVHVFGDGDHVMLGGVRIPHTRGVVGHSDADVALHALVDAILGALADGDIGVHFPPSDPQWRGAASARFLEYARDRVSARGGRIAHVDITIICEAPKIGPHRDSMRMRLAGILAIGMDRISVKATTTEGLGFAGRREGIAAQAVATVMIGE